MDIDGLGDKVVDQLIDAGLVHHFADLYQLTSEDLLPLEGFAVTSAVALVDAIAESKLEGSPACYPLLVFGSLAGQLQGQSQVCIEI